MGKEDTHSIEIDGVRYVVGYLDPFEANDLLLDLLKLFGPTAAAAGAQAFASKEGFADLLDGVDGVKTPGTEEKHPTVLLYERGILATIDRLDKQFLRETSERLAKVTTVEINGKNPRLSDILRAHFKGSVGALNKWLLFAVRSQYDFLSDAGTVIGRAFKAAGADSLKKAG